MDVNGIIRIKYIFVYIYRYIFIYLIMDRCMPIRRYICIYIYIYTGGFYKSLANTQEPMKIGDWRYLPYMFGPFLEGISAQTMA